MIFWLSILGAVAILSLSWAIRADSKVDRTLGIYTFVVASGLLIYSIIKG
jgi:hypothetical protein